MVDSSVVLGWIGRVAFWVLLIAGGEELGWKGRGIFAGLWIAGWLVTRQISMGPLWFTAFIAVLDIVLVLIVFKGDVRIR